MLGLSILKSKVVIIKNNNKIFLLCAKWIPVVTAIGILLLIVSLNLQQVKGFFIIVVIHLIVFAIFVMWIFTIINYLLIIKLLQQ